MSRTYYPPSYQPTFRQADWDRDRYRCQSELFAQQAMSNTQDAINRSQEAINRSLAPRLDPSVGLVSTGGHSSEMSFHCLFGFITFALTCVSIGCGFTSLHSPTHGIGFHIYTGGTVLVLLLVLMSWCFSSDTNHSVGNWWSWWYIGMSPLFLVTFATWTGIAANSYPTTDDDAWQPDVTFSFCMALYHFPISIFMFKSQCSCCC